jgi:hypothetical protein
MNAGGGGRCYTTYHAVATSEGQSGACCPDAGPPPLFIIVFLFIIVRLSTLSSPFPTTPAPCQLRDLGRIAQCGRRPAGIAERS